MTKMSEQPFDLKTQNMIYCGVFYSEKTMFTMTKNVKSII